MWIGKVFFCYMHSSDANPVLKVQKCQRTHAHGGYEPPALHFKSVAMTTSSRRHREGLRGVLLQILKWLFPDCKFENRQKSIANPLNKMHSTTAKPGLPDGFGFKPKIPIWVNFGGCCDRRCWCIKIGQLVNFMAIWHILCTAFWYLLR
jgi:hypothetical protein